MNQLLLRVEEAAKMLSLGRSRTYELIRSGELPTIRIGKMVRIPVSALAAWVEKRTEKARQVSRESS